jgi:DNA-binding MarR family transcriptional regulator
MEPIGRQLVFTAKAVSRHFEGRLAEVDGTIPTWAVLSAIELFDWRSQHELARSLQIEGATLTRHLDRLEKEGLVRRVRDESDRRSIHVETTDAGREAYERLLGAAMRADADVRALLTAGEIESLRTILAKLRAGLGPPS